MTGTPSHPVEALFRYFERHDIRDLSKLTGPWDHQFDRAWRVALNAHPEEVQTADGIPVPPWSAVVLYLGNPAAILSVITGEGTFVAGGAANVRSFIAALAL